MTGTANSWPFMWHGLEHEVTDPAHLYFEPSGNVYNPDPIELSLVGPQGIGGGGGPGAEGIATPSGGRGGLSGYGKRVASNAADLATAAVVDIGINAINDALQAADLASWTIPGPGWIAGAALSVFEIFNDIFDFFGGSDTPPIPRELKHQRHQVYGDVLGIGLDYIVDQKSSISGNATYYNLPGNKTASGEKFDPNSYSGAMFQKPGIHLGDCVNVQLQSDPSKSVNVRINDHGPFERDENGKPLRPLRADPEIVIDLTPTAFTALTGSLKEGKVAVTVTAGGTCQ